MKSDGDICSIQQPWLRLSPVVSSRGSEVLRWFLQAPGEAAARCQQLFTRYQQSLGFYVCPRNTAGTPPGPEC